MTELTIQASEELIKTFLQNLENELSEITHKDSWASARYLAWRASFEGQALLNAIADSDLSSGTVELYGERKLTMGFVPWKKKYEELTR